MGHMIWYRIGPSRLDLSREEDVPDATPEERPDPPRPVFVVTYPDDTGGEIRTRWETTDTWPVRRAGAQASRQDGDG